jgi:hypothetical protein
MIPFLVLIAFVLGCAPGGRGEPEPIQPGDYAQEPGAKAEGKLPWQGE